MKTYRIQVDLPEGYDEFWEEIAPMKAQDAKSRMAMELKGWLERGGWLNAKVKVVEILRT